MLTDGDMQRHVCTCWVIVNEDSGGMSLESQSIFRTLQNIIVRRREEGKAGQENGTARYEEGRQE